MKSIIIFDALKAKTGIGKKAVCINRGRGWVTYCPKMGFSVGHYIGKKLQEKRSAG